MNILLSICDESAEFAMALRHAKFLYSPEIIFEPLAYSILVKAGYAISYALKAP